MHTFFSAAFLTGLGTTVLILYLTTLPVSHAVQGAFVVAAVLTGAVFGGLAAVFKDIAECLGCLLGGFCLSMWLLTLHPGGLITNVNAKLVFIAAFTFTVFGLYFSHWTRTYGLIACISFSGATAVVLGVDCFSRAGLREFWAYIWDLNDRLFPPGTVTYPLTRGIRVELAVTVLIFLVGIISQLKLWRLIKDRRNKSSEEPADGELDVRDDEENIGRQVEETTNRERLEWERMYGDGSSQSPAELPLGTELSTPTPTSEKAPVVEMILPKDVTDEKGTVRVVEGDTPQQDGTDIAAEGVDEGDGPSERSSASVRRDSQPPAPELSVVPLPFSIPVPALADDEDGFSVAAVVDDYDDDGDHAPAAQSAPIQDHKAEKLTQRMSGSSTAFRWSLSQPSAQNKRGNMDSAGRGRKTSALPIRSTRDDDIDSVVATLDDTDSDGDADISELDWLSRISVAERRRSLDSDGSLEVAETVKLQGSSPNTSDDSVRKCTAKSVEMAKTITTEQAPEPQEPAITNLRLSGITELADETKSTAQNSEQDEVVSGPNDADAESLIDPGEPSLGGPESAVSFQAALARLTEVNLPPALPPIALTYRMNEWAKHLGAAETPEPETLQAHDDVESISDSPIEEAAPLDILELQLTAENATPRPAAARTVSGMSNYAPHHTRGGSRTSLFSQPEMTGFHSPSGPMLESPSGIKGHPRPVSTMPRGLFTEPIVEEDDYEHQSNSTLRPAENGLAAQSGHVRTRLSLSASALDLLMRSNSPGIAPVPPKPQTLIGMRETLLKSRVSGIFARFAGDTVHIPTEPTAAPHLGPGSDAGSIRDSYPFPPVPAHLASQQPIHSSSVDLELDDLPLSQRRAMILRTTSPAPVAANTPTAESVAFDSHQPSRRSSVSPEAVRQARLANFRSSVALDLYAASPSPSQGQGQVQSSAMSVRAMSPAPGMGMLGMSPSMLSLHWQYPGGGPGVGGAGASGNGVGAVAGGYHEARHDVLRTIDLQRNIMLGQKEAEAQRREVEIVGKQQYQREFEERMRSGALMDAHRDAMRRMQGGVKTG